MDVTWHIRPTADGCRVTIEHEFRRSLLLVGDTLLPRVVDRFFTRPIATKTLRTFKALAEGRGAAGDAGVPASAEGAGA